MRRMLAGLALVSLIGVGAACEPSEPFEVDLRVRREVRLDTPSVGGGEETQFTVSGRATCTRSEPLEVGAIQILQKRKGFWSLADDLGGGWFIPCTPEGARWERVLSHSGGGFAEGEAQVAIQVSTNPGDEANFGTAYVEREIELVSGDS